MMKTRPLLPLDPGDSLVGALGQLTFIPVSYAMEPFTKADLVSWHYYWTINSPARRAFHSLTQFGLIKEGRPGHFQLTAAGRTALQHQGEHLDRRLLRRLPLNPPIFRAIYDRFGWQPATKTRVLADLQSFGLDPDRASDVWSYYGRTALYVDDPAQFIDRLWQRGLDRSASLQWDAKGLQPADPDQ